MSEQNQPTTPPAELAGLTEAQRAALRTVAGDDPAKQIEAYRTLAPTWVAKDTGPAQSAPKENSTSVLSDAERNLATYNDLKKTNPVIAARFAFANGIYR